MSHVPEDDFLRQVCMSNQGIGNVSRNSSSVAFFLVIKEGFYLPSFTANLNQQAIIYGVGRIKPLQM